MKEPTIEELKNMSQREFETLLGKRSQMTPASVMEKCDGLNLEVQERRQAMLEQNRREPPKMYGQVPTKRKRHELGLGYLDEDDEQFAVKSVVDERVRRAKSARSQKEINDILAGLANE